jgi:hypothetical protein
MTLSFEEGMHVLHWCEGSWHHIDWKSWGAFRGLPGPWSPLPGAIAGEHYFVVCVIEAGRLFQIHPHRYLIDHKGRITDDGYFGVLSNIERDRYEALNKRYYEYPQSRRLTDKERKAFDSIRDRLWKSWLPPAAAIRELMRVLPALPEKEDAAWHVLEASGVSRAFGQA